MTNKQRWGLYLMLTAIFYQVFNWSLFPVDLMQGVGSVLLLVGAILFLW